MYLPRPFAVDDLGHIREFVAQRAAADLVTVDDQGQPVSTLMPCVWVPDENGHGPLYMHMSRGNTQWASIADGARGLAIIHGQQAYVSPRYYPSKAETGKVVPTWNYTAVHLSGTVTVSHDADELLRIITLLTDKHESAAQVPWRVSDAPQDFLDAQLKAIVAVTLHVDRIEAKAKLSQNRTDVDRAGALAGLAGSESPEERAIAWLMAGDGNPLVDG